MRAVLNQFFTRLHEDEEAKLQPKFGHFRQKITAYNFYVSRVCGPFEGGPRDKCLQCFPLQRGPAGIFRLLFAVK